MICNDDGSEERNPNMDASIRDIAKRIGSTEVTCPRCGFPMVQEIRWDGHGSKQVLVCTNSRCSHMRPVRP